MHANYNSLHRFTCTVHIVTTFKLISNIETRVGTYLLKYKSNRLFVLGYNSSNTQMIQMFVNPIITFYVNKLLITEKYL